MTGSKCLLDTSIIIHAFKSINMVTDKLETFQQVYVPATVVGELYYGAYKSANTQKHVQQVQLFLMNCEILNTDSTTAEIYGNIKAELSKIGKPIPENDIWIAAVALQFNIALYTADKHFEEVDGLALV